MTGRGSLLIAAAIVGATVALSAGEDIRITPIQSGKQILVSLAVRDAWTMGTREVLQSGVMLRFEYEISLQKPKPFWFFDQELARVRITSRAQYDTLGGGYKVSRMRNDRIIKSEQLHQEAEVRDYLTNIDQIALDPVTPLEFNTDYYVYVRLTMSPKRSTSLLSLLPLGREAITGRETVTVIK